MANSDFVKIVEFNFPDDVHYTLIFTEASSAFSYVYEYKVYMVVPHANEFNGYG